MIRIASTLLLVAALLAVGLYATTRLRAANTPVRIVRSVVTDTTRAQPISAALIQFRRHSERGVDRAAQPIIATPAGVVMAADRR